MQTPTQGNAPKRRRGKRRFGHSGKQRNTRQSKQTLDRALFISDDTPKHEAKKKDYIGREYIEFDLHFSLEKNLARKQYERATEIQDKAIPIIQSGDNVLGISATGSGKTGAFLIPMIDRMLKTKGQRLMVIAPTRELAMQIADEAHSFTKKTPLRCITIIGGQSMHKQLNQLQKGFDILVGTPGRINDHIKRGTLQAQVCNNIVVDEVDRMLDMGFIKDVTFIFGKIAPQRQALFFSATHNKQVERTVSTLAGTYDIIKLAQNTPNQSVAQSVIDFTHNEDKIDLLTEILKREEVEKAIIFVDTKRYADKIDRILHKQQFRVGVIHGDKRQNFRKRMIEKFTSSHINVLVATNVAARGLDIDDITHVINLDEPRDYDEYIHRIGRTGRNGAHGVAYTFVKRNSQ